MHVQCICLCAYNFLLNANAIMSELLRFHSSGTKWVLLVFLFFTPKEAVLFHESAFSQRKKLSIKIISAEQISTVSIY